MSMYPQNVNITKMGHPDFPDMVYYNLDIINGKTVDEGLLTDPKASYNETRDGFLIKDSSKYYFSIVRFAMNGPGKDLPIFMPRIEIGQPDINLTVYQVGLSVNYNGTPYYATKAIEYRPEIENPNSVLPVPPIDKQDVTSVYYYVYTYSHMVKLVNEALESAYQDLDTQLGGGVLTGSAPVLEYNNSNGLFSVYGLKTMFGDNATPTEEYNLYFNSNMWGLFSNFTHTYMGGDSVLKNNLADGFCYRIDINKEGLGQNELTFGGSDYWVLEQEYKSTSTLWCPISSIVFLSSLLPVDRELTGTPIQFGAGNDQTPVGTQNAFQPIVTDITLGNQSAEDYRGFIEYVPSAEYRLAGMTNSPTEVRDLDIQVFWKNRLDGNLYPISMFNLSSISIKILFRRRDYTS